MTRERGEGPRELADMETHGKRRFKKGVNGVLNAAEKTTKVQISSHQI